MFMPNVFRFRSGELRVCQASSSSSSQVLTASLAATDNLSVCCTSVFTQLYIYNMTMCGVFGSLSLSLWCLHTCHSTCSRLPTMERWDIKFIVFNNVFHAPHRPQSDDNPHTHAPEWRQRRRRRRHWKAPAAPVAPFVSQLHSSTGIFLWLNEKYVWETAEWREYGSTTSEFVVRVVWELDVVRKHICLMRLRCPTPYEWEYTIWELMIRTWIVWSPLRNWDAHSDRWWNMGGAANSTQRLTVLIQCLFVNCCVYERQGTLMRFSRRTGAKKYEYMNTIKTYAPSSTM